jgi:hypothetical protein
MAEFQPRWGKNNLLEHPKTYPTEPTKVSGRENFSPTSPENHPTKPTEVLRNAVSDALVSRLQSGSRWLMDAHLAWLSGKPDAANDDKFSIALAAWSEMEHPLRVVFGYSACIFGLDRRCPADAAALCDFCAEVTQNE